jgi:hypothetical protein
MRKTLATILLFTVVMFCAAFDGCDTTASKPSIADASKQEASAMAGNLAGLRKAYPIPSLTRSAELENLTKRATRLNKEGAIGYVYLLSQTGNVVGFYTIKGKVTSLNAYMTMSKGFIDDPNGDLSSGSIEVETPDVDGAYGENDQGIFFFTTEDVYVEWKGFYLYSDQPMKANQPVQLQQQVK